MAPRPNRVSAHGLQFIAAQEGVVLHPYNDPAGFATIGVGHLLHKSPVTAADKKRFAGFTYADAMQLLKHDVASAEVSVERSVHVPLKQDEFDALVSFVFNVGHGAFVGSTLLRLLNEGKHQAAADEFPKWVHAGNRVLPGLVKRRGAERKLFLGKIATKPKPIAIANRWRLHVYGDTDCDRDLLVRLSGVAKDLGLKAYVRYGKRSYAEQSMLWREFAARNYRPPLVARPGHSRHETGKAADVQLVFKSGRMVNLGSVPGARSAMKRHGLCLPVPGETWHAEVGNTWRA